jgi:hypothetical protein
MTVFCTYCSAEKDPSEGEIPAIQRYKSTRIRSVYSAAKSLGLGFVILSGKYGILEPSDPILDYDHLLQSSEVSEHSTLVAGQLEALGVKDLIFFSRLGPVVEPYRECINSASAKAGVELKHVFLPMNDA